MFATEFDAERTRRFVIRPNRSMSWRQMKRVYLFIVGYSLVIALGFAAMGYWPVLPFAGLELLALGAGFYLCALGGRDTEVVSVDGETVAVEKSRPGRPEVWTFQRAWAKVALLPPRISWYPSRLVIRSHGSQVPLGDFLPEDERRRLAFALRDAIRRDSSAVGDAATPQALGR